jgi:hypothetical protein
MSSKPRSKNTLAARATKLAAGARKHFPSGTQRKKAPRGNVTAEIVVTPGNR